MVEKKSFFRRRKVKEIRNMNISTIYKNRNLVKKILNLDPKEDALELRFGICPGRFYRGVSNGAEASRKCFKHGSLISLSQPITQREALESDEIPLAVRERDFSRLEGVKENEIDYIGYSFRPVQGEKRKRIVPFVWAVESVRLLGYSIKMTSGIEIQPYKDSKRVAREGANIICKVPSRTKKKSRYLIKLKNVPVKDCLEKRAIAWGIGSDAGRDVLHRSYNIKYNRETEREGSDVLTFYPQDMAAYFAVVSKLWKEERNIVPFQMSPFVLPSREIAEFYKKLDNNILLFDPSLKGSEKLRHLHIAEKSILLSRTISILGHHETFYCDFERDGKIEDYNWCID